MKKTLSILLAAILLLCLTAGAGFYALAENETNEFEYYILEDKTACISGYTGTAKDIVIPSKIDGYTVTEIGRWAFMDNNKIESVLIPDTIAAIRMNAFLGCDLLTSVTIPGSVKEIDYSAFQCENLENIVLCSGVEEIGQWAFATSRIKNIVIPESVTKIGLGAFADCNELEYAVILSKDCKIVDSFTANNGDSGNLPLNDFCIYGYADSTAQAYAQEWGYDFIDIQNVIMDGTDKEYTAGSPEGATIHCLYDLENLVSVTMDNETVDPAHYTLAEGSTILTFSPTYLDTLPAGEHTVTLNYKNAAATATLTILENPDKPVTAPDPEEPATDPSEPATQPSEPATEPETPSAPEEAVTQTPSSGTESEPAASGQTTAENPVKADGSTKSPDTGAHIPVSIGASVMAVAALLALLILKRKKAL